MVSDPKTRIIHLEGGQQRRFGTNQETRMWLLDAPVPGASFQDLFLRHYPTIRRKCMGFGRPGVAVVAVDASTSDLAGILCIAAKVGVANSAIVGRHTMADLYLDGDESLSLRHLAVIVAPLTGSSTEVAFRVLDLRTQAAFQDEHGRTFEALLAEGPIFIRCGTYVLFCMVTGDPTGWPESAKDGWACIPERVYLEADEAEPDRWQRKRRWHLRRRAPAGPKAEGKDGPAITRVQSLLGPVRARKRLLSDGEDASGTLRIDADGAVQYVLVGQDALRRGILLGRYERCDVDGAELLANDNISRVHLLLVEISGSVYAIDTASTNGTWLRGAEHEVRILLLREDMELIMGGDLAQLRWCPA